MMSGRILSILLAWLTVFSSAVCLRAGNGLTFTSLRSDDIPTNEVSKLMQDSDGFIWIVTYRGLVRYDGYQTERYSLNSYSDEMFDCQFHTVCELENFIYIGTEKGLLRLDKTTGLMSAISNDAVNLLNISSLAVDDKNRIWIGSDKGLFRKENGSDTFLQIDLSIAGDRPVTDITDIKIDDRNNLWIASWERGLFRLDLARDRLYAYTEKELSRSNVIHFDRAGDMWIGTWGKGLLHVQAQGVYEDELNYVRYCNDESRPESLLDDIIYDIEDGPGREIWIGGRSGLSILRPVDGRYDDVFYNAVPGRMNTNLPYNEVNSILLTRDGSVWLGMYGGGVCKVDNDYENYTVDGLDAVKASYRTSSIKSLCRTDDNSFWLGIAGHGLIRYNTNDGTFSNYIDMPEFEGFKITPTVDAIMRRKDSQEIWIGSYNGGVWVHDGSGKIGVISTTTHTEMPNDCITAIGEDNQGNVWICTRGGVAISDGKGSLLRMDSLFGKETPQYKVNDLAFDGQGNAWMATSFDGIVRASLQDRTVKRYSCGRNDEHGSFNSIFIDSGGRIWAGSLWEGLFIYDEASDAFRKIDELIFFAGKPVNNIEEDSHGHIWVTTDKQVFSLIIEDDGRISNGYFADISDSYEANSFSKNTCMYMPETDEMIIGCSRGLAIFPCMVKEGDEFVGRLLFTDLIINNVSYREMPLSEFSKRNGRIKDVNHLETIVLKHDQNNLTIRFSLLDFDRPSMDTYHYRLVKTGAHKDDDVSWNIVDGSKNEAVFSGLRPGKYVFEAYGTRAGIMSASEVRRINVQVCRNPLVAWYSILLYVLFIIAVMIMILNYMRVYYKMKRREEIEQMDKMKVQEINQAKLQFFTNVSHEFITPLSIILASVESLSPRTEQEKNIVSVMSLNVLRLTRLVQQILEFRKAETDNLGLKVSEGNAARFVGKCVDAFIPLVRKKNLTIIYNCAHESASGYFDVDKLDKIVYNLISNAVKYSPQNSSIMVSVDVVEGNLLRLVCTNQGKVLSQKVISGLFRRFYEGEYREFNSIGTGIGLSLVKSLVTLHKGRIEVESDGERGNSFIVTIPLSRQAYEEEEIDDSAVRTNAPPLSLQVDDNLVKSDKTVLCVDDSEDLCELFSVILSKSFNVLTCNSAEEALNILASSTVDVVITDMAMGGMNGLELCSTIKNNVDYSHIPVIMLTVKKEDSDSIEGYRSGVDGYLTKPCNFYVLTAMIDNLLKRQEKKSLAFRKQLMFEVKDIDYTSVDKKFLQKAIDVVNNHIADSEFSQSDFTDAMAMSRTVLTEKLKKLTGFTPTAFVLNARLTSAYNLIKKEMGNIKVADLAYSVGFNDPKYFTKRFKAKYGKSPKEMMDEYDEKTLD